MEPMDWTERRLRRERDKQINMRLSQVDKDNLQLMLDHMNKGKSSYNQETKTDAFIVGIDLYLAKNKLKKVAE